MREIRPPQAAALREAMDRLRIDPAPATVTHATLYRSHLSPKGPATSPSCGPCWPDDSAARLFSRLDSPHCSSRGASAASIRAYPAAATSARRTCCGRRTSGLASSSSCSMSERRSRGGRRAAAPMWRSQALRWRRRRAHLSHLAEAARRKGRRRCVRGVRGADAAGDCAGSGDLGSSCGRPAMSSLDPWWRRRRSRRWPTQQAPLRSSCSQRPLRPRSSFSVIAEICCVWSVGPSAASGSLCEPHRDPWREQLGDGARHSPRTCRARRPALGRDSALVDRMVSTRRNADTLPDAPLHDAVADRVDCRGARRRRLRDRRGAVAWCPARSGACRRVRAGVGDRRQRDQGDEGESLLRMSEVVEAELGGPQRIAVMSGPSFALEVARQRPTAVSVASRDAEVAAKHEFRGRYPPLHYG